MNKFQVIVWNVERLLHPGGSGLARSLDSTPTQGWTSSAYKNKIKTIGAVLKDVCGSNMPALLSLIEVENKSVVLDILNETGWRHLQNVDVPNELLDGYDVSLLFSKDLFDLDGSPQSFNIHNRYSTRDILYVPLKSKRGDSLSVLATHWPSRKISTSMPLRMGAADYCSRIVERLLKFPKEDLINGIGNAKLPSKTVLAKKWDHPVLILGDFNDEPFDDSVSHLCDSTRNRSRVTKSPRFPKDKGAKGVSAYLRLRPKLYNPSWKLLSGSKGAPLGSYIYGGRWYLLDQMLFSRGLIKGNSLRYVEDSLRIYAGKNVVWPDGSIIPIRTKSGKPLSYDVKKGRGVSDHLPISCDLEFSV